MSFGDKVIDLFMPTKKERHQGNRRSIQIAGPVNVLTGFTEGLNDGTKETVDVKVDRYRMYEEFVAFEAMIAHHDLAAAKQRMAHSLAVMNVVDAALADAGSFHC